MNSETTFIDNKYTLWYVIDYLEINSLLTGKSKRYVILENKEGKQKQILSSTLDRDYKEIVCPHYLDFILKLEKSLDMVIV